MDSPPSHSTVHAGNNNHDRSRSALDLRINRHKLNSGVSSNDLRVSESELYEKSRTLASGAAGGGGGAAATAGGGRGSTCASSGGANGSRVNLERKRSRMRIEGINRTRNLKKSIKIMVIIIALFLFSWLPIHLYRLTTTFYPILVDLFDGTFGNGATAASRVINFRVTLLDLSHLFSLSFSSSLAPSFHSQTDKPFLFLF